MKAVIALTLWLAAFACAQQIPDADARFQVRNTNTHVDFKPYPSREAWEARALDLRRQVLMAAGLWPMPERTPLNAQVFGKLAREGYTIEKAYFESYPGFYCTGNLYRPIPTEKRPGPFPGVWSPHGHWAYGRLHHDEVGSIPARAINLARQGYVVFTPDMVGYNDSQQISHQFGSKREQLWGVNVLGLQLWNSIRGLDFLQSLPDVDGKRLVATGASGGGTQTFLLTAVDNRIAAAVPVNMISASMQGGSNCENAANLRLDTFNVEVGALAAPRPMLMVAATGDWTKNTPKEEFPAVQSIYRLLGAEDKVQVRQFNAPHNYNRDSREAMYAFFGQWVLGDKDAAHFKERNVRVEFPSDMLVFYGRQRPPGVTEQTLVEQRIAVAERQMAALKPADAAGLARFREVMGVALRQSLAAGVPPAAEAVISATLNSSATVENLLLGRSGRGDRIPAALWLPPKRRASKPVPIPVVLIVHPDGKNAVGSSPLAAELLRRGSAVFSIDAFQTGEHRGTRDMSDRMFTTYNRTDDAERVQDILTALAYLNGRKQLQQDARAKPPGAVELGEVSLVGMERAGLWVLLARALAPQDFAARTAADAGQFETENDPAYLEKLFIPLIRRAGDFRTATALIAPAPLLIHNTGTAFKADWARDAYRAAGREAALAVKEAIASEAEIASWLAGKQDTDKRR
jgi:dienelactone hydrolase